MDKKLVSVVMGSVSDLSIMEETIKVLQELKISFEVIVTSAHRLPEKTYFYAQNASSRGIEVIIAGAGHAAHLAGVVASHSTLPVIGIPIDSSSLNGIDALLSTVQMPPGIPVATMAIGKSGAKNAALFAAQILANKYPEIKEKINEYRARMIMELEEKAKTIEKKYS
ncbi:MAG: 5-(carboxyamino)imidazole ribonucleotide mutase [Desulfobacterota bacterium]|nr:5-(carboxyamino)imidazole ribonucleotide mutase [Thermodesulfobacteriota bacterium]